MSVTLFASCKSSIPSVITCGANTLQIIACDLACAKENLGSTVFFISLDQGYLEHQDVQLITATDNCRVIKKSLENINSKQNQHVTCQNLSYIQ